MDLELNLSLRCLAGSPTLKAVTQLRGHLDTITSLPPYHRTRPCLAPRSWELCWALEEVSRNIPGHAHLVSLRPLQTRVWTALAHRAAQPPHTEGQQPTRKSLSFNKLMVGTCEL